jgi:hypothetical protein
MSRTPLIRRLIAIVVAAAIPFAAAAPSAHAAAPREPSARVAGVPSDNAGVGFTPYGLYRSSWS